MISRFLAPGETSLSISVSSFYSRPAITSTRSKAGMATSCPIIALKTYRNSSTTWEACDSSSTPAINTSISKSLVEKRSKPIQSSIYVRYPQQILSTLKPTLRRIRLKMRQLSCRSASKRSISSTLWTWINQHLVPGPRTLLATSSSASRWICTATVLTGTVKRIAY